MIYLVDTNVLLRFVDRSHPLHPVIRAATRQLRGDGHQLQVTSQNCVEFWNVVTLNEYKVPEPWSGRIEQVPILFLSSNPSISSVEDYPRWSWSDGAIDDFVGHGQMVPLITSSIIALVVDARYGL